MPARTITQTQLKAVHVHKTCACGRVYTRDEWNGLPFVGTFDDGKELTEYRNCDDAGGKGCTSTLVVVTGPSGHAAVP